MTQQIVEITCHDNCLEKILGQLPNPLVEHRKAHATNGKLESSQRALERVSSMK